MRQTLCGLLVVSLVSAAPALWGAEPIVTGSLAKEAIQKVINANVAAVQKCYEKRLLESPGLAGKLTLAWTIGGDGQITAVSIDKKASSVNDDALAACILKAVKTWKFPKPTGGGIVQVTYPFVFKATDTDARKAKDDEAKLANVAADAARPAEVAAQAAAPATSEPTRTAGGKREYSAPAGEARSPAKSKARLKESVGEDKPTSPVPADRPSPAIKKSAKTEPKKPGVEAAYDPAPAAEPAAPRAVNAPAMKAGRYDDNKQYNRFLQFLAENEQMVVYKVDVNERLLIKVLDVNGKSMPNCAVDVKSVDGKLFARSTTYADGSTQFFPADAAAKGVTDYAVAANCGTNARNGQISRSGKRTSEVRFDSPRTIRARMPVDVAFVLDTTGSMQSQIDRLKQTLQAIHFQLTSLPTKPDIRFGLVAYRDRGDDYITKVTQFTSDVDLFQTQINKLDADGGGDTPEDLQTALEKATHELTWRKDSLRVGFVISDAIPHTDYKQDYNYLEAMREGLRRGIKWVTVGAGGLPREGEVIFRQIAQFTMGEYVFITEGGGGDSEGGAGEASHHVGTNYLTENLDQAIIRIVRRELSYLTDEPKEVDDTIVATGPKGTPKDDLLAPAVAEALRQLVDYSAIRLNPATTVGVVPVGSADAKYNDVAGYLSDQFQLSASRNPVFKLVDRDLKALAQEQKLQLSDLFDVKEGVPIGKLIGAEVLIVAKLTVRGADADLFAKLIRVETGEVLSVAKVRVTGGVI
jgi:Mg-chelatase subunit ChlD